MIRPQPRAALWAALASLALTTPAFADAVLDQAGQLLASHQARAAHALLLPLEDERGGQPDYDYLLGLSALESGDPVDAAFAFERCLAVEPRNGPCRVQMARTHLALGERGNAEHELGIIRQNSPPPDVAQLISRYLGDLDTSSRQRRRSLDGYVAMGGGYDANANLATNQAHIAIPLFDNIVLPLARSGVQRPAGFGQSMAGLAGHYKLGTSWTLLGDADVTDRVYFDHGDLNSRNESLNLGGAYQFGASRYSASVQQQDYELHDQLFRRLWGGMLQYQYGLGDVSQLSTYAQTNRISYPHDQPYNVDRSTLGAACSLALPGPGTPVMFIGADAGREAVRNEDYAYNAQHFIGTRVGATAFVSNTLAVDVSLLTEVRHYAADNPVFLLTRKDRQYDISLGLTWKLGYGFSLRPNYAYTHNSSNIVIDSFARTLSSLDLRYDM